MQQFLCLSMCSFAVPIETISWRASYHHVVRRRSISGTGTSGPQGMLRHDKSCEMNHKGDSDRRGLLNSFRRWSM